MRQELATQLEKVREAIPSTDETALGKVDAARELLSPTRSTRHARWKLDSYAGVPGVGATRLRPGLVHGRPSSMYQPHTGRARLSQGDSRRHIHSLEGEAPTGDVAQTSTRRLSRLAQSHPKGMEYRLCSLQPTNTRKHGFQRCDRYQTRGAPANTTSSGRYTQHYYATPSSASRKRTHYTNQMEDATDDQIAKTATGIPARNAGMQLSQIELPHHRHLH